MEAALEGEISNIKLKIPNIACDVKRNYKHFFLTLNSLIVAFFDSSRVMKGVYESRSHYSVSIAQSVSEQIPKASRSEILFADVAEDTVLRRSKIIPLQLAEKIIRIVRFAST